MSVEPSERQLSSGEPLPPPPDHERDDEPRPQDAGRRRRTRHVTDPVDSDCEFASIGGPLVAVCALCGGAGASTFACLLAAAAARAPAARSGSAPVLACDAGSVTGGMALYLGVDAPLSLGEVSEALVADRPLSDGLFATTEAGLRVIATAARYDAEGAGEGLARVLADARVAHGLTVVDCGTLTRRGERAALAVASHVVWVLPATTSGLRRATRMLQNLDPFPPGRGIVVARRDHPKGERAPFQRLAEFAESRRAPLVLMPEVPDLIDAPIEDAIEAARMTLLGVATVLRRDS